jgi:tRNA dimethylallyltransferase
VTDLPSIVVVGGQTASGKSALALALALEHDGEIVGADSRQLYRGLPIASAGPTADERALLPHHLYESFDPATTTLTAGAFVDAADAAVRDVLARGKRAIIVGGTGLYLRAFRLGLSDEVPGDPVVRATLQREFEVVGLGPLVARLRAIDDVAAGRMDLQNPVRVLRALEIVACGGALGDLDINRLLAGPPRPLASTARFLLVDPPQSQVEQAIVARTRRMFQGGIVDEALALQAALPADHALLQTMGVQEAIEVGGGRLSVDDAVAAVIIRTRQYARRQRTWFRKEPWWTRWTTDG